MNIYKYPLPRIRPSEPFALAMPEGAEILCVQKQEGIPTVWAKIDEHAMKVRRVFRAQFTGQSWTFDIEEKYVGTWQDEEGLVWHLFDQGEA